MPQLAMHSVRERRAPPRHPHPHPTPHPDPNPNPNPNPDLNPNPDFDPNPNPNLSLNLNLDPDPNPNPHQVREMMGVKDLAHGLDMFKGFLKDFRTIDDEIGA